MTDVRERELERLDDRLFDLDPDIADLFADIDDILREAYARSIRPPRWPEPDPRSRKPSAAPSSDRTGLRGRIPAPVPATQRGPPAHRDPRRDHLDESEVMPVYRMIRASRGRQAPLIPEPALGVRGTSPFHGRLVRTHRHLVA